MKSLCTEKEESRSRRAVVTAKLLSHVLHRCGIFALGCFNQIGVSIHPLTIAVAGQRNAELCPQIGKASMLGDCPNLSSSHPISKLLQFFKLFNEPANLFYDRPAENPSHHYPAPSLASTKSVTVSRALLIPDSS
jgi:hypothetical protein